MDLKTAWLILLVLRHTNRMLLDSLRSNFDCKFGRILARFFTQFRMPNLLQASPTPHPTPTPTHHPMLFYRGYKLKFLH